MSTETELSCEDRSVFFENEYNPTSMGFADLKRKRYKPKSHTGYKIGKIAQPNAMNWILIIIKQYTEIK